MDELITVNVKYGTVEIVPVYVFEGDFIHYGSYSIHRDRSGAEIARTQHSFNFTTHLAPLEPEPKKTLWQKLKEWM